MVSAREWTRSKEEMSLNSQEIAADRPARVK